MQSTKEKRVWRKGAPPHVGWWNASRVKSTTAWRWWNGTQWSAVIDQRSDAKAACRQALRAIWGQDTIEWSDFYPADARVVRLDITYARRQRVVDMALEISAKNPTWSENRVWAAAKVVWVNEGQPL